MFWNGSLCPIFGVVTDEKATGIASEISCFFFCGVADIIGRSKQTEEGSYVGCKLNESGVIIASCNQLSRGL